MRERNGVYYVDVRRDGVRAQVCAGTRDRDVAALLEAAVALRLRGLRRERFIALVDHALSFDDPGLPAVADLVTGAAGGGVGRRLAAARFVGWLSGAFPSVRAPEEVTPRLAALFAASLTGKAATRRNVLSHLSATWKELMRLGLAERNPWPGVMPKAEPGASRTGRAFTRAEMGRIVAAADRIDPDVSMAICLSLYTGLREGDVLALRACAVDWAAGVIDTTPSKTRRFGRRVTVPIHPELAARLRAYGVRGGERVLAPALTKTRLSRAWKRVLAAGVTAQERDGAGGATVTLAVSCHLPADADGMAPADAAESACAHATLAALRAAAGAETGHARIVRTWELVGAREDSFEEGGRVVCAWECRLGINRLAAAFEGD